MESCDDHVVDEEAGAVFDALADHYDDNAEHAQIAAALVRLTGTAAVDLVVDVATGTGAAAFAALELRAPARIVAIDISAAMLSVARRRAATGDPGRRIRWLQCTALPLPLADGSVDLLLCASSLHFLGREALSDWQRVLRPGGQAAFSLPTTSSFRPSPQFRRLLPAASIRLPASRDDAGRLLEGTGLRLQRAAELPVGACERRVVLVLAGIPSRPGDIWHDR